MLTYIVQATSDLLAMGIFIGLAFAFANRMWAGRGQRCMLIALLAGMAAALVFAIVKTNSKLIDQPLWNIRFGIVSLVALVVLFLVMLFWLLRRKKAAGGFDRFLGMAGPIALAVFLFGCCMYVLPAVWAYPAAFNAASDGGVISTDFLLRLIGMIAGIVLIIVLTMGVYKASVNLKGRLLGILLAIGSIVMVMPQVMGAVETLMIRKVIIKQRDIFNFVKHDDSDVFMWIMVALAIVAVIALLVMSFRAKEPYDNPAQRRKIRAKWRNRRRWCAAVLVCIAIAIFNLTVLYAIDNQEVELSPSEECEMRDDGLYIPFEQVNDGSLHRFTYTTDKGTGVRFIIIQKPNSQAYGIGLDACEICGQTGYYQRGDQVVCKKCDVVMNINTIGFKGGCNPIPIDYTIKDGYIIVPFQTLIDHEEIFTR